jgi:hypothetical protein
VTPGSTAKAKKAIISNPTVRPVLTSWERMDWDGWYAACGNLIAIPYHAGGKLSENGLS